MAKVFMTDSPTSRDPKWLPSSSRLFSKDKAAAACRYTSHPSLRQNLEMATSPPASSTVPNAKTTGASKPCGENLCEDKTHVKESYRVIGEKNASGKSNKDNVPR
ncbi:hypothetical protein BDZ89DRAFT_1043106 [Hymenopellis radicata]|nr:hypothetical protein BDZ89DRAFT_1043106 [Hymenopellis radicata]